MTDYTSLITFSDGNTLPALQLNTYLGNNIKNLNERFRQFISAHYQTSTSADGGTATSGAWTQLPLNTIAGNMDSVVSLSANRITNMPAGTFLVLSWQLFSGNLGHLQIRINSSGGQVALGLSCYSSSTESTVSQAIGVVTFASAGGWLEHQYYCGNTVATTGLGDGSVAAQATSNNWANVVYGGMQVLRMY